MSRPILAAIVFIFLSGSIAGLRAQFLEQIGLGELRAMTNLDGAGVVVGQVEAATDYSASPLAFEVNPAAVGQPTNLFTWNLSSSPYVTTSVSTSYPNALGNESGHADQVGNDFYGLAFGVATNVAQVNNYEANGFFNYYIEGVNHTFAERIVNQSFTFGTNDASVDQAYDNYAAQHNVLFVSGAGLNNLPVYTPATCYNGIGVGVYNAGASSPSGPTPDGHSKPDLTVSGFQDHTTSYTTPLVAGAAALLLQAGARGDGGPDTNVATDIRTLKALLLNGAVKPVDWTNSPAAPLHPVYGAGVLNVFNSYEQLAGGENGYLETTQVSPGGAHPPVGATGGIAALSGWNFATNTSGNSFFSFNQFDAIQHYYFNVTNGSPAAQFTVTATLVWNRQSGQSGINNLALFLYDCASSNLVTCSTSLVDNVQHIYLPGLAPGRYDLQVWKAGGSGIVSASEPYALAWQFAPQPSLTIMPTENGVSLAWPLYPAGFKVEWTTNLASPVWSTNLPTTPVITNGLNVLGWSPTNAAQFFRLEQMP